MVVTIDKNFVNIRQDSLTIDDGIEERSTCAFVVIDPDSNHYHQGESVIVASDLWNDIKIWDDAKIWEDDTIHYAGFIEKPTEKKEPGTGVIFHSITCKDMHYLADKRIIAKAYENVSAGFIVSDLISDKLSSEGVTVGIIQDGPNVIEAIFNYTTVTTALESLAEKAGYIWYIDYDKKLYFMARETLVAPWTATAADMKADSVQVEHGNSSYRNTQYVKGGRDITDHLTENKLGDGATRSWTVGFKIAKEPVIKLNGIAFQPSEIGIRGLEENKKYYWSKGDNTINQDESQSVLSASDTLSITYQGEFDIIVKTMNPEEIDDRQDIEGGSGIVEDVADEMTSTTREAAFEVANAKLKKYGVIGRRLSFRTRRKGLFAGQILTVNLPEHGINAEMLIESVDVSTEQNTVVWYDVTCAEGPEQQSWTKMFEVMATRGQSFVVRENINEEEVLITLKSFEKTWESTDSPNIFKELYASGTLYPSLALYPAFADIDRVKYVELLGSSNNVIVRKQVTKQTGLLNSITYIAPFEGIGTIAKVRWYGGYWASQVNSSGIMVDEQPWAKVKTSIEALQIDKTDIRNFTPTTGTLAITARYMQGIDDNITKLEEMSV